MNETDQELLKRFATRLEKLEKFDELLQTRVTKLENSKSPELEQAIRQLIAILESDSES